MSTKISALLDGELDADEARTACVSIYGDEALRRAWCDYHLIGDALRSEPCLDIDMTRGVMTRLAAEPVVLAPKRRREWQQPALALAASAAGVAVVAWLVFAPRSLPQQNLLAQNPQPFVAAATGPDMQEYLIAHEIHSGSIYLNGDAQHIRTVSAARPEH